MFRKTVPQKAFSVPREPRMGERKGSILHFHVSRLMCPLLSLLIFLSFLKPTKTYARNEIQFVDVTAEAGIHFKHTDGRSGQKYLLETLGSGAVFFDYDNDGDIDLYIVNGADLPGLTSKVAPKNVLYRNNGNGAFTDVTARAGVGDTGYGVGCAAADYDNDGYQDLYVTNYGPNVLYHNNGDGTFTDVTKKAGVGDSRWSTSCAFLDYNLDGYLDLYVVNYIKFSIKESRWWEVRGFRIYCSPTDRIKGNVFVGESDTLYRNNGDGTFTDVTKAAAVFSRGLGLAVAVGDYDNDGDPDIHVANDMEGDYLFRNNGDSTFTDVTLFSGAGYDEHGIAGSGMGSAFGDYNNDGYFDIVVSNASSLPVILYRNEKFGFFPMSLLFPGLDRSRSPISSGRLNSSITITMVFWTSLLQTVICKTMSSFLQMQHTHSKICFSRTEGMVNLPMCRKKQDLIC